MHFPTTQNAMRDLSDYSNMKAARFVSLVQRYKRRTDMQRAAGKTILIYELAYARARGKTNSPYFSTTIRI